MDKLPFTPENYLPQRLDVLVNPECKMWLSQHVDYQDNPEYSDETKWVTMGFWREDVVIPIRKVRNMIDIFREVASLTRNEKDEEPPKKWYSFLRPKNTLSKFLAESTRMSMVQTLDICANQLEKMIDRSRK